MRSFSMPNENELKKMKIHVSDSSSDNDPAVNAGVLGDCGTIDQQPSRVSTCDPSMQSPETKLVNQMNIDDLGETG